MIVVDFLPEHILELQNYGGQEHLVKTARPEDNAELKRRSQGSSITVMKDSRPIACGGIAANTPYRGLVWAVFQKTTPSDFVFIHKASVGVIQNSPLKLIEAYVDPRFKQAMRWIKMLGFTLQRPYVPLFFADGSGASAWVLFKE